ncbi:MAG: hypothetical protein ACJ70T_10350 [Nitrososphaera sp.]
MVSVKECREVGKFRINSGEIIIPKKPFTALMILLSLEYDTLLSL